MRVTIVSASERPALDARRMVPRRMEQGARGVSGSTLEGLDGLLTVNRQSPPPELRRSLACTHAIENMQGTMCRARRNVKRWRDAAMALRWAAARMSEAMAGVR